jgi:acetyltransferase-like isoleucine patch superfamily enzyme
MRTESKSFAPSCGFFLASTNVHNSVSIHDSATVTIGDRVLIGPGVRICTDTHEVEPAHRWESNNGSYAKKIEIGDDVWIGMNACILPGVTIGRGCTIAGGAVVAEDVEEFSMVGGVPATLVRKLKPTEPAA